MAGGTGFVFFASIFGKVDQAVSNFVNTISSNVVDYIVPFVTVGLSISITTWALMIMLGESESPMNDFLKRVFTIAVVTFIAGAGGIYQTQIADAAMHLPEEMATNLLGGANQTGANLLDACAGVGFQKTGEAFNRIDALDGTTWGWAAVGIAMGLVTLGMVGLGGVFIMCAKVIIGLLVALGPIFIYAFLWDPLRNFFSGWINHIVQYSLLMVMFSAMFAFFISLFKVYVDQVSFDNSTQNLWYTTGGLLLLGEFVKRLAKVLPQLASGLSQGVHLSGMRKSGGSNSDKSGGGAGNGAPSGGGGSGSNAGSGSGSNAGSGSSSQTFRGKNAA